MAESDQMRQERWFMVDNVYCSALAGDLSLSPNNYRGGLQLSVTVA